MNALQTYATTPSTNYFNFEVKCDENAILDLQEWIGVSERMYRISMEKGAIELRDEPQILKHVEIDNNDLITGRERRPFWIEWSNSNMRIGRGESIGGFVVLNHAMEMREIKSVALKSNRADADWLIEKETPTSYHSIVTSNIMEYINGWIIPVGKKLEFKVKAKSDIYIALAEEVGVAPPTTTKAYELIIAKDNEQSVIRRTINSTNEEVNRTPDILSEAFYQRFWLSWENNEIQFGIGRLGVSQPILTLKNATRVVKTMHFAMSRDCQKMCLAYFKVAKSKVYSLTVQTPDSGKYERYWGSVEKNYIFIKVTAKKNAQILLSTGEGVTGNSSITLSYGVFNNRGIMVKENELKSFFYAFEKEVLDEFIPNTLWIKWDNAAITLGKGGVLNSNIYVKHGFRDQPINIRTVSVSTQDNRGIWKINNLAEDNLISVTEGSDGSGPYETKDQSLKTEVTTCSEVNITFNDENSNVIASAILNTGNHKSILQVKINDTLKVVRQVQSLNLLNCEERRLWMNWKKGLRIGYGEVNENILLGYSPKQLLTNSVNMDSITSIFFMSSARATWRTSRDESKYFCTWLIIKFKIK